MMRIRRLHSAALVLGLGELTEFSKPDGDLWVSQPQTVEAQVSSKGVWLQGRQLGRAFVSGVPNLAPVQEVVVLNPQDARAVRNCKNTRWDYSSLPPTLLEGDAKFWNCPLSAARLSSPLVEDFKAELRRRLGPDALNFSFHNGQFRCAQESCPGTWIQKIGALSSFVSRSSATSRPESLVIEIHLAEVSRSRAHQLGLQLPTEFSLESSKDWARKLTARMGEQGGFARVLAQPQLRTLPGERARFQSGGEVPITTSSAEKVSTQFKPYGLIVDLTPSASVQNSGTIELQFSVELSEPLWKAQQSGPPSFTMRKLESRFRIPSSDWVLLTTMQESRLGTQQAGIFGLRSLPGLGALFGHESLFAEDAELWFAVRASWSELDVGQWQTTQAHR